jgi:hypothetical protein
LLTAGSPDLLQVGVFRRVPSLSSGIKQQGSAASVWQSPSQARQPFEGEW